MSKKWTENQMPDLNGKVVVVTGANSGLGYESVKALVRKNAEVVMACRNLEKGQKALDQIKSEIPHAKVELIHLDLGSLHSVREFVGKFEEKYDQLDVLMNNAGIMAVPESKTAEGFESQFGVNHLGHFVLTRLLLDKLENAEEARVVNVASLAASSGKINFDDLMGEKTGYNKFGAYGQSKLANVLFTQELNERLEKQGYKTRSIAAHPGGSNTNLGEAADLGFFTKMLGRIVIQFMQPASQGALSQLYAATDPNAQAGKYYGPDGFGELSGYPKEAKHPEGAKDPNAQKKLWVVSEELTQVSFLSEEK